MMYVNGCGAISPQDTFGNSFPFAVSESRTTALACMEPTYKSYIPPMAARRMSRVVKMGVTAASIALKDAGFETVDAIIAGTGMGCMAETERFLGAIIDNGENYLNPAPFIHSTHNTISSQVALFLKCTGYNQTFVHGPASFESALLDGMMLSAEGRHDKFLIGGIDEMTPNLHQILKRFGLWKKQPVSNLNLIDSGTRGTIAGEGASFFLLGKGSTQTTYARLTGIDISPELANTNEARDYINRFLDSAGITITNLDLCMLGKNGDNQNDGLYRSLEESVFQSCPKAAYKHLCGEYATAGAFAMWLACHCIRTQTLPDFLSRNEPGADGINSVLVLNQVRKNRISLVLLGR